MPGTSRTADYVNYRFTGHETFPCRYAWLPKAIALIGRDSSLLADDKLAMVELGLGKNMVRATRFWVQVSGMATVDPHGGYSVTMLGECILGPNGLDPFLEDLRTLWLLHWQISTYCPDPLFAWDYLLNRWPHPELSKSAALRAFRLESNRLDRDRQLSDTTLEQHFDTFLHTYIPTRSRKGEIQEDNLDCPLVELRLLDAVGERRADASARREPVYAFRREDKPEISPELFLYCLEDYWNNRHAHEQTLALKHVAVGPGSPGQIFKLPELEIRERLERLHSSSGGIYSYRESSFICQLSRTRSIGARRLLEAIYRKDVPK